MNEKGVFRDITGTILIAKGSSSAFPDLSILLRYNASLECAEISYKKYASIVDNNFTFTDVNIEPNRTYTLVVRGMTDVIKNDVLQAQCVAQATKIFQGSELINLDNLNNLNICLDYFSETQSECIFKFKVSIPKDTEVNKIEVSNTNNQTNLNFNIETYTEDSEYKVFEKEIKNILRGDYNLNVQYFSGNVELHKYSNIHVHFEPRLTSTFDRTELSNFKDLVIDDPVFTSKNGKNIKRNGSSSKPFRVGDKIILTATEGALISADGIEGSNPLTITLKEVGDNVLIEAVASKEYYCDAVFSKTYVVE